MMSSNLLLTNLLVTAFLLVEPPEPSEEQPQFLCGVCDPKSDPEGQLSSAAHSQGALVHGGELLLSEAAGR